jgi:hypothetical protein
MYSIALLLSLFSLIFFGLIVTSSGGVVLASKDGKIVCENTLDARLDVVFRQKLPQVGINPWIKAIGYLIFSVTKNINKIENAPVCTLHVY